MVHPHHFDGCSLRCQHPLFQTNDKEFQWSVVRPTLVYCVETRATMKSQQRRLEVNEMRMLRWMCRFTKKDKIRNEHVRGSVKVEPVTTKMTEKRLKWYGHVKRREEGHVIRRMLDAPVQGKRRRGRQTARWTCQEKGRRARAKKNVRCTSTRKETERKTDNQVDMSREGKKGTC